MGTLKELFFDIPKELAERFEKEYQRENLQISDYLTVIADSLGKVGEKLESNELPKEDGNFLMQIIEHAKTFSEPLKEKYPVLANVFDIQLEAIMFDIQISDYYIDNNRRWNESYNKDAENIYLSMTQDSQIKKASEAIKKTKGIISAHAIKFKIDGK